MTTSELGRQVLSAVLGITTTGLLLSHYATGSELCVLAWLTLFALGWITTLWMVTRRRESGGRMRWTMAPCVFAMAICMLGSLPEKHKTINVRWRGLASIDEIRYELRRQSQ